jgi:predicted ester cyclase
MKATPQALSEKQNSPPEYFGYSEVVPYILGITHEIWERRQIDSILDYYGEDIEVFSLEGITRGAKSMVKGTRDTLDAFPDRLLLGDDIIWSGNLERGFSSHRITSPMTNLGDTLFSAATGRPVRTMNIADCEISHGQITGEWLFRDNLALVQQLGIDTLGAARTIASRFDDNFLEWLGAEHERVKNGMPARALTLGEPEPDPLEPFARRILEACWINGDASVLGEVYTPYTVLQRAPVRIHSGLEETLEHWSGLRHVFPNARLTLDHICSQPYGARDRHVAVRWSVAARHRGDFAGIAATGQPVYIVGATHWRIVSGCIVAEWTVFDELALMAQLIAEAG